MTSVPADVTSPARVPITVLLVDDHTLVRAGFRRLLEDDKGIGIVGEAGDATTAIKVAVERRPAVTILDYVLPGCTGLVVLQRIRELRPEAAVLMLSMRDDEGVIRACRDAGARGFLPKTAFHADLTAAVRRIAGGGQCWDSDAVTMPRRAPPGLDQLSPREREVLTLLCRGRSAQGAAAELGLSVFTVRAYRASIMRTWGLRRTMSLVAYAVRRGLVDLS